jgi:hypothetical protein
MGDSAAGQFGRKVLGGMNNGYMLMDVCLIII